MRIETYYSHLNGWEFIQVHNLQLWREIEQVIASIDANACRTKVSKERRIKGKLLYSPKAINKAMTVGFKAHHWDETRTSYWVTSDPKLIRNTLHMTAPDQKAAILAAGQTPLPSSNQTDFVKQRIAVEVQFGKYTFVAFDLFVKHMAFFVKDIIDVGVEILPMKALASQMSSGVAYYERELYNLIREGRGVPAVPLILLGVAA